VPLSIETVPNAEHVDCAAAEAGSPTKAQQTASAIANIGKVDRFFTNNVSFAVTFIGIYLSPLTKRLLSASPLHCTSALWMANETGIGNQVTKVMFVLTANQSYLMALSAVRFQGIS
jgi:hypothetical protein